MKRKKVISILIMIVLLLISSNSLATTVNYQVNKVESSTVSEIPKVSNEKKVYDFANVLTMEEEISLYGKIKVYIDEQNIDLIIVTKDKNIPMSDRDFAVDFYNENNFGVGIGNKGIIFLINTHTQKLYVYKSGVPAYKHSDKQIEMIKESVSANLTDEQYYDCANEIVMQLSKNRFPVASVLVFSLLVSTIVVFVASGKHKTNIETAKVNDYLEHQVIALLDKRDILIRTNEEYKRRT